MNAKLTRTHVILDGRSATHREMMLAATQDDRALAAQYREIITRDIIPAALAEERRANAAFDGAPMTVSGGMTGGHGSFSAVSAVAESAELSYWYDLRCDYQAAVAGRGPGCFGERPWQHA